MARKVYTVAKRSLLTAAVDMDGDDIKVMLLRTGSTVPNENPTTLAGFTSLREFDGGGGYVAGGSSITTVSIATDTVDDRAEISGTSITFTGLTPGTGEIIGMLVYKNTGSTLTSIPLLYFDEYPFPFSPSGTDVVIGFDTSGFWHISNVGDFLAGFEETEVYSSNLSNTVQINFRVGGTVLADTIFDIEVASSSTANAQTYTLNTPQITVPAGGSDAVVDLTILSRDPNADKKVYLQASGPGNIDLFAPSSLITLENAGSDNPFAGIDGDFSQALASGVAVPERQAYEPSLPDLIIYQNGNVARVWSGGQITMTVNNATIEAVMFGSLWYDCWMDKHGANYPGGPDTVPIGTELAPVAVFCEPGPLIQNRDGTRWGPNHNGSIGAIQWNDLSGDGTNASIHSVDSAVVRDIVFYGDFDTDTVAKLPQMLFSAGIGPFGNQNFDNVRFDLISFIGGKPSGGDGYLKTTIGLNQVWTLPQGVGFHGGKLKFYDCQLDLVANAVTGYSIGSNFYPSLWGMRFNGPVGLDIRTRTAFRNTNSRAFFRASQEHCMYNDEKTGPASGNPVGNFFIGLRNETAFTIAAGSFNAGPSRTMLQIENRPNTHGTPTSHGPLAIIDCYGRRIGEGDGATAFTIQGHGGDTEGGTIYIENIGLDDEDSNANSGVFLVSQGFSGGVQAGPGQEVEGRSRFVRAGDPADHTYCADRVVINGITVASGFDNNGRALVSLPGCRQVDIHDFDFTAKGSTGAQFSFDSNAVQAGDIVTGEINWNMPGVPSAFAGWGSGTKVEWGPHKNTWNNGFSGPFNSNLYSLTDTEINALPALVEEVRVNRSLSSGNGRFTILNAAWTHASEPTLPVIGIRNSLTLFNNLDTNGGVGYCTLTTDGGTAQNGWDGSTECLTRYTLNFSGDVAAFTVEVGDLDLTGQGANAGWNLYTPVFVWPAVDRNAVLESVWLSTNPGLGMSGAPDRPYKPRDVPIRVTPVSGLASGPYSLTIDSVVGEIEFPKGSGTWVVMLDNTAVALTTTFTYTQP